MRLLIVVNVDWFFLSHRLPIAKAAVKEGWDVHIATTLTESRDRLEGHGFTIHQVPMHRSSSNPFGMLATVFKLFFLMRKLKPQVVHSVTIKPVLLGGIAARLARARGAVFAVSGLGHVFVADGRFGKLRKTLVRGLYKLALARPNKIVIFQNDVDEAELLKLGCVARSEVVRLPGSGFDVDKYEVSEIPQGPPVFLMASRLIRTKGVLEFAEAATKLRERGVSAEFWLVGSPDHMNPEGLSEAEVEEIGNAGDLKILGHRDDVPDLMRSASVIVLPSYYGEGLPKVLIEAAAAGRAVVTTDTPGCRDAIENGVTGLLIRDRDADELALAMQTLAADRRMTEEMGCSGRQRAERLFRIEDVVDRHLEAYRLVAGL